MRGTDKANERPARSSSSDRVENENDRVWSRAHDMGSGKGQVGEVLLGSTGCRNREFSFQIRKHLHILCSQIVVSIEMENLIDMLSVLFSNSNIRGPGFDVATRCDRIGDPR